jgi:glycosyl hydrolase family 36
VIAYALLGQGKNAWELFSLLNPVNRTSTRADVHRYKVEPYVIAADVYSVAPHIGRGGWTWYTGSAGWMYRAGLEGILGFRVSKTLWASAAASRTLSWMATRCRRVSKSASHWSMIAIFITYDWSSENPPVGRLRS